MKKHSINKIKMISVIFFLILTAGLISHFRAYFYSEESLEMMANKALSSEILKLTPCDEVRFLKKSLSANYGEVMAFEWVCLNIENDEYLIVATIESDGYVDVSRVQLNKSEIKRLISLN
jgi:hypothetical protein